MVSETGGDKHLHHPQQSYETYDCVEYQILSCLIFLAEGTDSYVMLEQRLRECSTNSVEGLGVPFEAL